MEGEELNCNYGTAFVGEFSSACSEELPAQRLKVFVRGDDGPIPCFHVRGDYVGGRPFHTRIRMDSICYLPGPGMDDTLSRGQKKDLVEFLKARPRNRRYKTHWEYACSMWNDNNRTQAQVDEDSDIPDYTELS